MKKLRILALMHEDLVPPEDVSGFELEGDGHPTRIRVLGYGNIGNGRRLDTDRREFGLEGLRIKIERHGNISQVN